MRAFKFTDIQCEEIGKLYEGGETATRLSNKFNCDRGTIRRMVLKSGRLLRDRHSESARAQVLMNAFTSKECEDILIEYEKGARIRGLQKKYKTTSYGITDAIKQAGGSLRDPHHFVRIYIRKTKTERRLYGWYRLKAEDVDWMYSNQNGMCLWCKAPLPKEPLDCNIDHIHFSKEERYRYRKNRTEVRGLCCSDNQCNLLAGIIEKRKFNKTDWGLLNPIVQNIKEVLEENKGNLPFPREEKE